MAKKKSAPVRVVVGVSLSPEMNKHLREFSRSHAMSNSAVIKAALKQYMDSEEIKPSLVLLSNAFNKIAETGKLDAETTKQIQAFDTLIKLAGDSK